MTIPNIISAIRIILIPVFCVLFFSPDMKPIAFTIIVISGISDIIDGKIARALGQVSNIGKVLDPIADKLFQLSTVLCFCIEGKVGWLWWLLIIMVAKELFMLIGGTIFYKRTHAVIAAEWYGKVTSVLFFSAFVLAFFFDFFNAVNLISVIVISLLFAAAITFSIISVVNYTRQAVVINNEAKRKKEQKLPPEAV